MNWWLIGVCIFLIAFGFFVKRVYDELTREIHGKEKEIEEQIPW